MSISENEWLAIHAVWTKPHINEEMWENYKWMFNNRCVLPEQYMLRDAQRIFRERFKKFRVHLKKLSADEAKKEARTRQSGTSDQRGPEEVPGTEGLVC